MNLEGVLKQFIFKLGQKPICNLEKKITFLQIDNIT